MYSDILGKNIKASTLTCFFVIILFSIFFHCLYFYVKVVVFLMYSLTAAVRIIRKHIFCWQNSQLRSVNVDIYLKIRT